MGGLTVSLALVLLALSLIEAEQMCSLKQSFNRENPMYEMAPEHHPETGELTYESRSRLINKITVVTERDYRTGKEIIKCFSITAKGDPEYCAYWIGWHFNVYIYNLAWWEYIYSVQWYDNTEDRGDYQNNGIVVDDLLITTNRRAIHHTTGAKRFKYTANRAYAILLFMSSTVDTGNPSKPHKITFYFACTNYFHFCGVKSYDLADDVLGALKQDSPVSKLATVIERYHSTLWPQAVQVGCNGYKDTGDDYYYGKDCCQLLYMLEQMAILHNMKTSLMKHEDKTLIRIDRFDSSTLLSEARKSLDFHNLMTNIKINNRQITNNGRALGNYFNTLANYDKGIKTQDQTYLTDTIDRLTLGVNNATNDIKDKVKDIIKASVYISAAALVEAIAKLAAIIVEQMNPLGVIFGNFDAAGLFDAMDQVAEAGANVAVAATLLKRLDSYVKHMQLIKENFAGNAKQLATLAEIVLKFPRGSAKQRTLMTEDFISAYGGYTPQVTLADLVYCTELLQAVVSAACDIIDSSPGMWAKVGGAGYSISTQDCLITPVKIEQLGAYYDELYAFQFDLVDALAGIVRADLASSMSSELTATNQADSYDSRTAAIGAAMVHINYQSVARERCNELQYKWGGKLQPECKKLYIDNADIPKIISNNERTTESESTIWAYIPMSGTDRGKYIDMATLVRDKEFRFQLPFEDTQWMMDYGWLPSDYNSNPHRKEVSYFVKSMDVYIPGIWCKGGKETWLGVDVVNSHPTRLFVQDAPDKFSVKSKVYAFAYLVNSNTCAGPLEFFKVKDVNLREVLGYGICVESRGEVNSDILPSLYSIWNFRLRSSCELEERRLDYEPLITIKIKRREVLQSGLDMCWPDNSRCTGYCRRGTLSYTCLDKH